MENAKREVKEIMDREPNSPTIEERQQSVEDLKIKLNTIVHCHAPEDTTVKEVEAITMVMLDMVLNPKDYTKSN
jgi:hypothetical protein